MTNYFEKDELECPCCHREWFSKSTLEKLNQARANAGVAFSVNSACRCELHNKDVGGSPNSSHKNGHAVDIRCANSSDRFKIVVALLGAGFTRIGIYKTFIHVDDDPMKPSNVIWYGE